MIKICNILPNNMINETMPRQEYELYLTHQILKDPKKFEFLSKDKEKRIESYKILDNSACELGSGLSLEKVFEAAKIIGADEIVLPDLPRKNNSLSETLKYLKQVPKDCPYKLAAVVQGETFKEVIACAEQILTLKRIDTIMIPKWYCQMDSTNGLGRHKITEEIIHMMGRMCVSLEVYPKRIHWLGMDTGMRELIHPLSSVVRSIDTGLFAAMSTDEWSHLDTMTERPRELKINLDQMDVSLSKWKKYVEEQQQILEEINV